ncbi:MULTISPECIES: ACP S-malonyltransferase [Heyndrickxia]|uniref:ACP S-malonyltransferase n=1 Tax=Heyndrickxia TaxID=2837504 RepID=UPI00034DEA18|nr:MULTISPECIES: ACP S-malonyltransferase [Heyndrickxia]MDT9755644.1 ACP S-malonyltransferase [Heyndrickxia coagulans]MEC2305662.1 ACP S-malonyltransferase [Weizmannia sp. CD-2023]MEC2339882.1 ACP S-malonyltransferase [Weizmannia sp. CD-2023]MED4312594.1 ACP S-malonyltransferase [Heyndrickxia coagulans]MED4345441.1 ACP S-malonyltransferase [Heyndrickxia coagulans]
MGKIAFVFPGQGSQTVGMGQSVAGANEKAAAVFQKADEKLGMDLSGLIQNGPLDKLTRTENAQPALLSVSTAILQALQEAGIHADFTAGHSLGEYSALVAAGALSFEDAVYAVRKRGEYMDEAFPNGAGAMSAVLGLGRGVLQEVAEEVSSEGETVQLANLNCPGQIVISGTAAGIEKAGALAKERGAKRVLPLQVSGPFHSKLMEPAAEKFKAVLDGIAIRDAAVPVIANVDAEVETGAVDIKAKLIRQLYSPVLWEDSVKKMISLGVDTFIEVGPGKVLSGLIRKIDRSVKTYAVQDMETLEAAVGALQK